jgi:ribulose-5-phosphate 4-epimerase/fuculose-1-phosphate aldolase
VHSHSPAVIPFGVTGTPLRPVFHMTGFLGIPTPVFEIRETAGSRTDMLIRTPALGAALARKLGSAPVALMRGHGSVVVGVSVKQAVYRAVYAEVNARLQAEALRLGPVTFLSDDEALSAATANDSQLERPWALWKDKIKRTGR